MKSFATRRAVLAAALFAIGCSAYAGSSSGDNKGNAPDFAYPADVAAKSQSELSEALRHGDGKAALAAVVRLSVARSLVNSSDVAAEVGLIDSVSRQLSQPWRAMGLLLEAKVLTEVYQDNSWHYDQRTIPVDNFAPDPLDWSGAQFNKKVGSLVSEAMPALKDAYAIDVASLGDLARDTKDALTAGMSAADFMAIRAVDCLNVFNGESAMPVIPFFGNAAGNATQATDGTDMLRIIDSMIEYHDKNGSMEALAAWVLRKVDITPYAGRADLLESWMRRLDSNPACAGLVSEYAGYKFQPQMSNAARMLETDLKDYIEFYAYVKSLIAKFEGTGAVAVLTNLESRMSQPSVALDLKRQYLAGGEVKGSATVGNAGEVWFLLYRLPDGVDADGASSVKKLISGRKPVASAHVVADSAVPSAGKYDISFGIVPPGRYAVVPSSKEDASGIYPFVKENGWCNSLTVSDLVMATVSDRSDNGKYSLYVAEARGQHPVEGARVRLYRNTRNGWTLASTHTTDRNGHVDIPVGNWRVLADKDGSYALSNVYNSRVDRNVAGRRYNATVLTDLSIYHPGDTVGFAFVAYSLDGTKLSLEPDMKFTAKLYDANRQEASSVELTTDGDGRASGRLVTPAGALLGRYSIAIEHEGKEIGWGSLQVADYKQPTFYVELDDVKSGIVAGDTVTLKGRAATYSGMPLPGAEIDFQVDWQPWWRMYSNIDRAGYGASVQTGADGSFEIVLPTAALEDTPYERGIFRVNVSAVSPSGETAQASPVSFSLGKQLNVTAKVPQVTEVKGKTISWPISLTDMIGGKAEGDIQYELVDTDTDRVVAQGTSRAPELMLKSSDIPSARYKLKLTAVADTTATADFSTVVWRADDKKVPYMTPLWTPTSNLAARPGEQRVAVRMGGSYRDDMILCVISSSNGDEEVRWIKSDGHLRNLDISAPADGERRWVWLSGMHDLEGSTARVEISPASTLDRMSVETLTWRDRLLPGSREKVSFRFKTPSPLQSVSAFAVMTDKAIDALAPFEWDFNPQTIVRYVNPVNVSAPESVSSLWQTFALREMKWLDVPGWAWPAWNLYGYSLYGGNRIMNLSLTRSMKMSATAMKMESAEEEDMAYADSAGAALAGAVNAVDGPLLEESAVEVTEAKEDGGTDDAADGKPLRGLEHPLAFFRPDLKTTADGLLEIEFEVPDFNTTWQMQLVGYDNRLNTAGLRLEAVASKPVMVSVNAPRFVRTGDKVSTIATLYNNTDSVSMIGGRLVWLDAVSGTVIADNSFAPEPVGPMQSRRISIDLSVSSSMQALALQAYATSGSHTDGEQANVPVYPSTTVVTESQAFYLKPGEKSWSMTVDTLDPAANVTLQYCDNPVWLCVASLPDISVPDNSSITSKVDALYANSVAAGLAARYPDVRKAIEEWQRSNDLASPLRQNSMLKTVALEATPWVNDAASETLRMSRLSTLLDSVANVQAVNSLLADIASRQTPDGGWSWCPSMPSSYYMTMRTLDRMAYMVDGGYISADKVKTMAAAALRYCDSIAVEDSKRASTHYDPIVLLDYVFARQRLASLCKGTVAWNQLQTKAVKAISSGWKKLGIRDKATAAMVLWRAGDRKTPLQILESLRQFATVDAAKGACYANLSSGMNGMTPILVTSRVLEAYSLISPSDPMADSLRQWLVLSRQTMDWGRDNATVAVTAAILGSGTDWTQPTAPAVISLGSRRLEPTPYERLTGSITLPLDAKDASGAKLDIERHASGPAWGGVVTQTLTPMRDVASTSAEGLGVTKALYAVVPGAEGQTATSTQGADRTIRLRQGDMVRVTLTLDCERDMNYVALTDELPACLQPASQLSGYECNDGLWSYREARASKVSLFFTMLPKGSHVVSYDCYVTREGDYAIGIATAQSQYAPAMTGHSAGGSVEVRQ